jgi:WD40 repeat protein
MAREVVISCGLNEPSFHVWEPGSLTVLASFIENCTSHAHSLLYTPTHVISAQGNKNLINYYKFGRVSSRQDTPERKSTTIDRVSALTQYGTLIAGGSEEGNITLWEAVSGQQLLTWNAHFRTVSALSLSDQTLVSAGEDGALFTWRTHQLAQGNTEPLHSYNPHTMPIRDMKVYGAWVLTCSQDQTCKYMAEGQVLKTYTFPCALNALELVTPR